jgi:hypothetical protein
LLAGTAEHVDAVRGVLSALSPSDIDLAISLASRLNTRDRRDEALLVIGEAILREGTSDADRLMHSLVTLVDAAKQSTVYEPLRRMLLRYLGSNANTLGASSQYAELFESLQATEPDPDVLLISLASLCGTETTEPNVLRLAELYRPRLIGLWGTIEDDLMRVSAGFTAVDRLGKYDAPTARRIYEDVRAFLDARGAPLAIQETYRSLLTLFGRSLAMLANVGGVSAEEVSRLKSAIEFVSSDVEKARVASSCALLLAGACKEGADLLTQHFVVPVATALCTSTAPLTTEQSQLIVAAAPSVFRCQESLAFSCIQRLDESTQQDALGVTLANLIHGRIVGEPYRARGKQKSPITDVAIVAALRVLERVTRDSTFSYYSNEILARLIDKRASPRINDNQREFHAKEIEKLASLRLPDPNGIQHEGYTLLLQAHLLRLRNRSQPEWAALLQRTLAIPNISDSCFVLAKALALVPRRYSHFRQQCREHIFRVWGTLPTLEERIWRLEQFYDDAGEDGDSDLRPLIQACVDEFNPESVADPSERYRILIELAHKVDEEWAASLVSVADQDPTRRLIRSEAKRRIAQIELEKKICDPRGSVERSSGAAEVSLACWRELGVMNCTRTTLQDWTGAMNLLRSAKDGSFTEMHRIWSYIVGCLGVRYHGTPTMRERVGHVHEGIVDLLTLARQADVSLAKQVGRAFDSLDKGALGLTIVAKPHSRVEVLRALEFWLARLNATTLDVVDRYFSADDIELLALARRANPTITVRILVAAKDQKVDVSLLGAEYRRSWSRLGYTVDPPSTVVLVVGRESDGDLDIHDRWWFCGDNALEFGTSFNGLGGDKWTSPVLVDR